MKKCGFSQEQPPRAVTARFGGDVHRADVRRVPALAERIPISAHDSDQLASVKCAEDEAIGGLLLTAVF